MMDEFVVSMYADNVRAAHEGLMQRGLVDLCLVDGERVEPQPGGYYGGWITSRLVGPFKGTPGSETW